VLGLGPTAGISHVLPQWSWKTIRIVTHFYSESIG
jgi:hypothetical protein